MITIREILVWGGKLRGYVSEHVAAEVHAHYYIEILGGGEASPPTG